MDFIEQCSELVVHFRGAAYRPSLSFVARRPSRRSRVTLCQEI